MTTVGLFVLIDIDPGLGTSLIGGNSPVLFHARDVEGRLSLKNAHNSVIPILRSRKKRFEFVYFTTQCFHNTQLSGIYSEKYNNLKFALVC